VTLFNFVNSVNSMTLFGLQAHVAPVSSPEQVFAVMAVLLECNKVWGRRRITGLYAGNSASQRAFESNAKFYSNGSHRASDSNAKSALASVSVSLKQTQKMFTNN